MTIKPVRIRDLVLGPGRPGICIPIVGESEKEIVDQAIRIRSYPCDLAEFRADWYEGVFDHDRHARLLCDLREALGERPLLYTFRTQAEGGKRDISYDSYRKLLLSVSRSQMADMIIVISFFSVGFTAFLYLVVDTILDMISGIKAKRKARKERKAKEKEQAEAQEA